MKYSSERAVKLVSMKGHQASLQIKRQKAKDQNYNPHEFVADSELKSVIDLMAGQGGTSLFNVDDKMRPGEVQFETVDCEKETLTDRIHHSFIE